MNEPTLDHPTQKRSQGHWLLFLLLAVGAIAGIGYTLHYRFVGAFHVSTDDAYVNGNLVRLAPQVSGTVVSIDTDAAQFVTQGQLLVQLDRRDCEIALDGAKASLGETVREVAQSFENVRRDEASVQAQQALLAKSMQDLSRDRSVASVHGVSLETLAHDEQVVRSERASLAQAQATLAASRAAVVGTTPESHPRVLQAESNLRGAWLACARTGVRSPVTGYVVRRAVQLGQQVTPGTEMLAIVPGDSVWIDANFKETQLDNLRTGQAVTVKADMYKSQGEYHGTVRGVTAATGSALSVLPAQNASGNWIKIVQRLPVRIALDPAELAQRPLPLGASTTVDVDTHDRHGTTLSAHHAWQSTMATDVYATQEDGADSSIAEILSHNLPSAHENSTDEHTSSVLAATRDSSDRSEK
jgi:membrane fusion protein, multidrug efflux system